VYILAILKAHILCNFEVVYILAILKIDILYNLEAVYILVILKVGKNLGLLYAAYLLTGTQFYFNKIL
jgi:hypothetical protein